VLGQLAGSAVSGNGPVRLPLAAASAIAGDAAGVNAADGQPDVSPSTPSPCWIPFCSGSKSLEEVWRLLLPPNALLELRR